MRLTMGDILRDLLVSQPRTNLVDSIKTSLLSGDAVADEDCVSALEVALLDPRVLERG